MFSKSVFSYRALNMEKGWPELCMVTHIRSSYKAGTEQQLSSTRPSPCAHFKSQLWQHRFPTDNPQTSCSFPGWCLAVLIKPKLFIFKAVPPTKLWACSRAQLPVLSQPQRCLSQSCLTIQPGLGAPRALCGHHEVGQ